jgi:hypothetical protein
MPMRKITRSFSSLLSLHLGTVLELPCASPCAFTIYQLAVVSYRPDTVPKIRSKSLVPRRSGRTELHLFDSVVDVNRKLLFVQ